MEVFHTRKQTLVFFMPGFLFGILYINFIAKQYLAEPGIFSPVFLERFVEMNIAADTYLQMLLRLRALPFLVLFAASMTRVRKIASILFLLWTGFSAGVLLSQAYIDMGLRGGDSLSGRDYAPVFVLYPCVSRASGILPGLSVQSLEQAEDLFLRRDADSRDCDRTLCESSACAVGALSVFQVASLF